MPQQPATQATLTIINSNKHTQTTKQPHSDKIQQQQQQQQKIFDNKEQTPMSLSILSHIIIKSKHSYPHQK